MIPPLYIKPAPTALSLKLPGPRLFCINRRFSFSPFKRFCTA